VNVIVKAKGPSGPAKILSDDPKHALGLVKYLRTIGYKAWKRKLSLRTRSSKCPREQTGSKDRVLSCSLIVSGVLVSTHGRLHQLAGGPGST
jgi:hypothetical protein